MSRASLGDRWRRAHAGIAHPRLLRVFHRRPLHRRLWPDRVLQRRHADGSGARDREDRLGRPRAAARRESRFAIRTAKPLPAGRAGEICLRGAKITQGYWRDAKKTAASFYGDWFRTGDVGYLDDDGFLYLTDRVKDMIISGGENIASSEVERVIYQMPQVREAAVIGLPDEKWGERPVAVVVMSAGHTLDYETLASHCRAHLAAFKVPKS